MRVNIRPTVVAGVLTVAAGLWGVGSEARAQAVGGSPYRGAYPGYYYSPGGYSGGYYFTPGYYRGAGATAAAPARSFSSPTAASPVAGRPTYNYDWTTGRTNFPVPLSKPWLRPMR